MRNAPASPDDIDPATLWSAVRTGLPRILLWTTAVGALTFGVLTMMAPSYQSEAQLTIDAKTAGNPFTDPKQSQSSPDSMTSRMDKEAINTHIRSLQSPALAAKIVNDLKLKDNVEFNSELGDADLFGKLLRMAGLGGVRAGQTEQDRVLEAFTKRLEVYSARESRFIGIKFTSIDPRLAAGIPNALAEAYREQLAGRQVEEIKDVQDALAPKIEQLTKDVSAAEIAVEQFKGKSDLLNTGAQQKQTLNEQQLGELTNELSRAQALRSENESRAKAAQEMLRGGSGDAQPDVQKSPLIQNLIQQRVRVERQIAELNASLLPGHPRMQQLNADLAGLKKQITAEVSKIVDGLGKEAKVAADREIAIKKRLADLKVTVVNSGPDEARLKLLTADAKSKREELERLQAQSNMNKTRQDSKAVPVEAKLIAPATPSSVPVFPKKLPVSALASGATFILGLAWTILGGIGKGARSGGARPAPASGGSGGGKGSRQVPAPRAEPELPVMAKTLAPAAMAAKPDRHEIHDEPLAAVAAIASPAELMIHVLERTPERGGYRTLLAGETDAVDASAAAIDLAKGLSQAGQPVVLIEWSYGQNGAARQIGAAIAPGMAELVSGAATFEDVITSLPGSECHFIPAGRNLGQVDSAHDPDQVNLILDALDEAYTHIVVVGEHAAVRVLFETIEGRFDAGVLVNDPANAPGVLRDPPGTFLGFEVADIELLSISRAAPVAPPAAAKGSPLQRLRGQGASNRSPQPA